MTAKEFFEELLSHFRQANLSARHRPEPQNRQQKRHREWFEAQGRAEAILNNLN